MSDTSKFEISFLNALLLTMAYFAICLLIPTAINTLIWRKSFGNIAAWLNIATLIIFSFIFFFNYCQRTQYKIDFLGNITPINILLAIACSILFFLLLDKCLDPIFDKMFQSSADEYQETLVALRQSPVMTFIRVCLFAPITEEILMRGYILNGLQNKYGVVVAIIISALLFAILHFNFVQTLSAVICGLVLGLLYIKTAQYLVVSLHTPYIILYLISQRLLDEVNKQIAAHGPRSASWVSVLSTAQYNLKGVSSSGFGGHRSHSEFIYFTNNKVR